MPGRHRGEKVTRKIADIKEKTLDAKAKASDAADGYDILPEDSSVYVTGGGNDREIPAWLIFGEC